MSTSTAKHFLLAITVIAGASIARGGELVELVKLSGLQGGLIVHVDCGDAAQTGSLRWNERFLVQGLDVDEADVQAARAKLLAAGQYGPVSVSAFDGAHLPYVDNLVNLLIVSGPTTLDPGEILRVLCPGGVALVTQPDSAARDPSADRWRQIRKPWPAEIDQWTHFLHGPDNNAVARDRVVANPRAMQWIAEPRWGRSHEELASMSAAVTAGGRVFYILDEAPLASIRFTSQWQLIARDAFNGQLLWKQAIPAWTDHLRHFRSGPVHLPRRLVAVGDRVYVTRGLNAAVTVLDAATGQTLRTVEGTEFTEEIVVDGGLLYLVVGTSEVERFGGGLFRRGEPEPAGFRYVTAVDAETGLARWKKTFGADEFLLPQTLAVAGRSVFCQTTAGLVRLDAGTGDELWRASRPTPPRRMSFSAPTLVVAEDVVLLADQDVAHPDSESGRARGGVQWGVNGWNEPGFERQRKSTLRAYAVDTGRELWSAPCSEGYNSPVDVLVVKNTVWVGADFAGYDLKSGEPRGKLAWKGDPVGMAHHRCYRNKATEDYLLTGRSGVEVVSWERGWLGNNSWLRGTCQYGIMPANGLIYAPPNACACFGKVKTPGFFAAAPQRGPDARLPLPDEPVVQQGRAYAQGTQSQAATAEADDWPMYRHDPGRSGATATTVPAELARRWSATLGGRLTQAVIAAGRVFVASTDTHTIHALDVRDGSPLWRFTAGGRIDSSPTVYDGQVLFGSADGWVYCLRASDGELAWRFRAAPREQFAAAYGQLESVWPVHGAVLVQHGILYASAGRSSYLDGGIVLYALNPATGGQLSRYVISHLDPATGQQIGKEGRQVGAFDMEGVYSDILSGDGTVFLKHLRFAESCLPMPESKPHLFAVTGFLGEEWFVRSYWLVAENVGAGWSNWAKPAGDVPFGRILCVDGDHVYGYGRTQISGGPTGHRADAYHLYARDRTASTAESAVRPAVSRKGKAKRDADTKQETASPVWSAPRWSDPQSLIVRAMVLAGDQLIVAGPPDLARKQADILAMANEEEALAGWEGKRGVQLRVISASDGVPRFQTELTSLPVFDGMSVAAGQVFIALQDGSVECWSGR